MPAARTRTYLGDASPYFTWADREQGYSETRKRLAGYPDDQLAQDYLQAQKDSFDKLFGHHARQWGNLIVEELLTRQITQIPNIFGPITVRRFGNR